MGNFCGLKLEQRLQLLLRGALCAAVCVDIIDLLNSPLCHYWKRCNFTIRPLLQVREELMLCTAVISSVCCISSHRRLGIWLHSFTKPFSFSCFVWFCFFFFSNIKNNRRSLRLRPVQRSFWGLVSPRLGISHTRLLS